MKKKLLIGLIVAAVLVGIIGVAVVAASPTGQRAFGWGQQRLCQR